MDQDEMKECGEKQDVMFTHKEFNTELDNRLRAQHENFAKEIDSAYRRNEELQKELNTLKELFRRLLNL